jgi:hypothetical protein
MEKWTNCRLDTLYYDNTADIDDECEVTIDGSYITVTYGYDGEMLSYFGEMKGEGHFELKAPTVNGHATLHRFNGGRILEGYWVEDNGYKGMWRITLA